MAKSRRTQETRVKRETVPDGTPQEEYVLFKRRRDGDLEMLASGRDSCRQKLESGGGPTGHVKPGSLTADVKLEKSDNTVRGRAPLRKGAVQKETSSPSRTPRLPQLIASDMSRVALRQEADEFTSPARAETTSFRIDEEEKVKAYLFSRLVLLQQQADKRIAKAWIKGICPKKQARYPYQNTLRVNEGQKPIVPEWWPVGLCQFKEPDHIGKEDRMALCLHLLRLRPTVDQLSEWSGSKDTTDVRNTYESLGWTDFLKQMTSKTIFDGLDSDHPEKRRRRETILRQMYDVARMEEEYLKTWVDGNVMITWEDEPEPIRRRRTTVAKRSRQSSVASNDSCSQSEREPKRVRHDVTDQLPSPHSQMTSRMSHTSLDGSPYANGVIQPATRRVDQSRSYITEENQASIAKQCADFSNAVQRGFPARHMTNEYGHAVDPYRNVANPPSMTSSFGCVPPSAIQKVDDNEMQRIPATACIDMPVYQNFVQAYAAYDIPEPPIETVLNTPVFSPITAGPCGNASGDGTVQRNAYRSIDVSHGQGSIPQPLEGSGTPAAVAPHPNASHHMTLAGSAAADQRMSMMDLQFQPQHYAETDSRLYAADVNGLPRDEYCNLRHPSQHDTPYYVPRHAMSRDDMPAATLPGSVTRGFTGHKSGVGGGAWI